MCWSCAENFQCARNGAEGFPCESFPSVACPIWYAYIIWAFILRSISVKRVLLSSRSASFWMEAFQQCNALQTDFYTNKVKETVHIRLLSEFRLIVSIFSSKSLMVILWHQFNFLNKQQIGEDEHATVCLRVQSLLELVEEVPSRTDSQSLFRLKGIITIQRYLLILQ